MELQSFLKATKNLYLYLRNVISRPRPVSTFTGPGGNWLTNADEIIMGHFFILQDKK